MEHYNLRCDGCKVVIMMPDPNDFTSTLTEDNIKMLDGTLHNGCPAKGKLVFLGNNSMLISVFKDIQDIYNSHNKWTVAFKRETDEILALKKYNPELIREGFKRFRATITDEPKDNDIEVEIKRIKEESANIFKTYTRTYDTIFGNDKPITRIRRFHELRRSAVSKDKIYGRHGMTFSGDPRTGKGTTATAMVKEELNPDSDIVIRLKSGSVISGNLKDSAKSVESMIKMCRTIRDSEHKSIHIIIDEAERKIPSRNSSSHNQGVLASSWLEEFGGMEETNNIYLYIITNDIEQFDKAMINDGRVSILITFELPDDESRINAFKHYMDFEIPNLDYQILADLTKYRSVSFIEDICSEAENASDIDGEMTAQIFYDYIGDMINEANIRDAAIGSVTKHSKDHEIILLIWEFMSDKTEWNDTSTILSNHLNNIIISHKSDRTNLCTPTKLGIKLNNNMTITELESKGISVIKASRGKDQKYLLTRLDNYKENQI